MVATTTTTLMARAAAVRYAFPVSVFCVQYAAVHNSFPSASRVLSHCGDIFILPGSWFFDRWWCLVLARRNNLTVQILACLCLLIYLIFSNFTTALTRPRQMESSSNFPRLPSARLELKYPPRAAGALASSSVFQCWSVGWSVGWQLSLIYFYKIFVNCKQLDLPSESSCNEQREWLQNMD